jgi:hypothetical protein
MGASPSTAARPTRGGLNWFLPLAVLVVLAVLLLAPATEAFAGQASSGQLFFYPCTNCHPVNMVAGPGGTEHPSKPLPNGMQGHKIVLEAHDKLGSATSDACLVCHDDPSRNPGKLKLIDGTLIDVTGDISLVCYRCHESKYKDFKQGTHGNHKESCVAAGCHDPHTPNYLYAGPIKPFTGVGFQFKGVGQARVPFKPLMQPPLPPPTVNPTWFLIAVTVGLLAFLGLLVRLVGPVVVERLKR